MASGRRATIDTPSGPATALWMPRRSLMPLGTERAPETHRTVIVIFIVWCSVQTILYVPVWVSFFAYV